MSIREQNLNNLCHELFDVVIVGAGINGAVTANALAARGVRVALIDKRDFAGNTSSNSSNLIWGGIKYLENHEYGLVNKLCKSRNRLMTAFPSTVKETRFLATVIKGFRFPGIFMYFGTLLYWAFGRFKTQAPKYLTAKRIKQRESIINIEQASGGFEYSDCHITDGDARFVWGFVRKFLKLGGVAVNYIESQDAQRIDDTWTLTAQDLTTGQTLRIRSKVLINKATDAKLRIDANCGWTAGQALLYAYDLMELGVELVEQPLPAEDWKGMKEVYKNALIPLFADESCVSEEDVEKCVGHFHGINIKLMKCGGITPALRMIKKAKELGLKVMMGCMTECSIGISAIAHFLPLLDFVDMDGILLNANDPATGVTINEDGTANFPEVNGTGVKLKAMMY